VTYTHRQGGFCTPNAKIPRDEPASHGEFLRRVTETPLSMCVGARAHLNQ